jgi:hypothetical protein
MLPVVGPPAAALRGPDPVIGTGLAIVPAVAEAAAVSAFAGELVVPTVPVADGLSVIAALRVAPDAPDAAEGSPLYGGTCPPERLIDVADVRLLILEDSGGLPVPPGFWLLTCVGFVSVKGSNVVAPRVRQPTSVTVSLNAVVVPYVDWAVPASASELAACSPDWPVALEPACSAFAVAVDTATTQARSACVRMSILLVATTIVVGVLVQAYRQRGTKEPIC